jgi:hypothetical protein
MRIPLNATGAALVVAGLVLAVAGCGDRGSSGTVASSAPAASSQASAPPSSTSKATVLWPAPPDPLERTVAAGLVPEPKEHLAYHAHAHLDIFIDGAPIEIPAGIGINVQDPEVRRYEEPDGSVGYGDITLCATPCISPLHTHDPDGILHTESAKPEPNTLGQFFIEWGVTLSDSCVGEHCRPKALAFYVNGEPSMGDPREIELTDQTEIAIVIGTPPARIPDTADFSQP